MLLNLQPKPKSNPISEILQKNIFRGEQVQDSQYLIIEQKLTVALHGKYSPDIEDVQAIAHSQAAS